MGKKNDGYNNVRIRSSDQIHDGVGNCGLVGSCHDGVSYFDGEEGPGSRLGCGRVTVVLLATVEAHPKPDDNSRSTSLKVIKLFTP
ncbi:hypothetical protein RHMOL_Rhmol01G0211000 [Rhododendron molle]|uniref:Uncharacterized protein n=1 Tax=Rhododendron molle TaxID=49168 RepID=A0ACC0Q3N3_RHOML|nr:hypothetical protein RHMOL_Rhmol01G0211000 [Rhododendron molle]